MFTLRDFLLTLSCEIECTICNDNRYTEMSSKLLTEEYIRLDDIVSNIKIEYGKVYLWVE